MSFRLLCVGAHPDDESGAFGGALLLAHARGIETRVLCLTDGQAASNRGTAASPEELARMRREELVAASAILGLTGSEQLNYPDGKLERQNFYELAGVIVERIRLWRPQVVITFGPEGGANLHRDHAAASLATTAAFHWAGQSQYFPEVVGGTYTPQKLYYFSPPFFIKADPEVTPRTPYSLELELGEWKERKLEAFRAHSSQAPILDRIADQVEKHFGIERYLLAAKISSSPYYPQKETDMFAGVKED